MVFDNYSDAKVSGEFIAAQLNIAQLRKEGVDCKILYTQDIVSTKKNYLNVLASLFFSIKSFSWCSDDKSLFFSTLPISSEGLELFLISS